MITTANRNFRIAAVLVVAVGIVLMSAPAAWAGPAMDLTLPTPTSTPGGSVTGTREQCTPPGMHTVELQDHSFSTSTRQNCTGWTMTRRAVADVPPAPKGVNFSDAVTLSNMPTGFLPFSLAVCFSTTDSKAVIYYLDDGKFIDRWVALRTSYNATTKMACTNVRFGNVTFALGHK